MERCHCIAILVILIISIAVFLTFAFREPEATTFNQAVVVSAFLKKSGTFNAPDDNSNAIEYILKINFSIPLDSSLRLDVSVNGTSDVVLSLPGGEDKTFVDATQTLVEYVPPPFVSATIRTTRSDPSSPFPVRLKWSTYSIEPRYNTTLTLTQDRPSVIPAPETIGIGAGALVVHFPPSDDLCISHPIVDEGQKETRFVRHPTRRSFSLATSDIFAYDGDSIYGDYLGTLSSLVGCSDTRKVQIPSRTLTLVTPNYVNTSGMPTFVLKSVLNGNATFSPPHILPQYADPLSLTVGEEPVTVTTTGSYTKIQLAPTFANQDQSLFVWCGGIAGENSSSLIAKIDSSTKSRYLSKDSSVLATPCRTVTMKTSEASVSVRAIPDLDSQSVRRVQLNSTGTLTNRNWPWPDDRTAASKYSMTIRNYHNMVVSLSFAHLPKDANLTILSLNTNDTKNIQRTNYHPTGEVRFSAYEVRLSLSAPQPHFRIDYRVLKVNSSHLLSLTAILLVIAAYL